MLTKFKKSLYILMLLLIFASLAGCYNNNEIKNRENNTAKGVKDSSIGGEVSEKGIKTISESKSEIKFNK